MSTPLPGPDELVELAAVVRAHGLRGELLLKPFNPGSEIWGSLERVFVRDREGGLVEHVVERAHQHGMNVILGLRAVHGREAAEALRGSVVCVTRADFPALGEDEHYIVDLIGLTARDTADTEIGRVVDVIDYPSVSCLVVENEAGRVEVPNTERYVLAIDTDAGFVRIDHLDELDILREAPKKGRR